MPTKKTIWSIMFGLFILGTQGQVITGNSYMEKQLLCALDRAPCDLVGSQIKDVLPEIIGNNCQSCDRRQAANAGRIARFVQNRYPEVWNALVKKYSRY